MRKIRILHTDVLIVGGGAAAIRAALAAKESHVDVLLISKGEPGKSGATYSDAAEIGAFNVPDGSSDVTDSPDIFYKDILNAAKGLSDHKLSRVVANEAIEAKHFLEDCGMQFDKKEDGNYNVYQACFSSKPRSHVIKNHFKPLLEVLFAKAVEEGVEILEGVTLTNLIVHDGQCFGAFAIDLKSQTLAIVSKCVVLATGGASTLFKHNMYPKDVTGDGYASAYRAGAQMSNMEFIQAGLGLAFPKVNLFGNQLWEAMPRLTNGLGESFIEKYSPYPVQDVIKEKIKHFPFSVSDISKYVEISIQKEITEGTPTDRKTVYLDFINTDFEKLFKNTNSSFKNTWPITYNKYLEMGIDLYKDKIEVACFAHAINGGVVINEKGESSIKGLFAAGEVAAGPHGADRLGGNMLVTCMVFGKISGLNAARKAKKQIETIDLSEVLKIEELFLGQFKPLSLQKGEIIFDKLQQLSDKSLLIVRNEEKLLGYLNSLEELERTVFSGEKISNNENKLPLSNHIELLNLITTGKLIAKAALLRKESRGSHYREDYPNVESNYAKNIVLQLNK